MSRTRIRHRRTHLGTCQDCNEVRHTARFTSQGVRAKDLEGGRWLCPSCADKVREKHALLDDAVARLKANVDS